MKRIQAACLMQTVHFQPKDIYHPVEFNRQQAQREYEAYKDLMKRHGTAYKILEELPQADGSLIIKLKKQNNQQPLGSYFD